MIGYYLKNLKKVGAIKPVVATAVQNIITEIGKYVGNQKYFRILELGSGTGNITLALRKAYPQAEIFTIERDIVFAQQCRLLFEGDDKIHVFQADAVDINTLSIPQVDVVINTLPLSLLQSTAITILKKVSNLLISDGLFVSAQVTRHQNKLYASYIGYFLGSKRFRDIQPILTSYRKKRPQHMYINCFPAIKKRTIKDKILRLRELFFGIQLHRDLIPRVEELNTFQVACSFSYLPLESYGIYEIDETIGEYKSLIDIVSDKNKETGIQNDITIKLYQFGQYLFSDYFRIKILELVEYADVKEVFLWFDTSDRVLYQERNIINETISIFEEMYYNMKRTKDKPLLGICLQSYHHRTDNDIEHCICKGYVVRLVKGFYKDGDIRDWREVTSHYETLAKKYLLSPSLEHLAIATHDKPMIDRVLKYVDEQNIDKEKFSIQGFRGIQDQYYVDLRDQGYQIKIYIPYGNFLKFVWRGGNWMDTKRILRRIMGMKII